jgi:hypothetical protein
MQTPLQNVLEFLNGGNCTVSEDVLLVREAPIDPDLAVFLPILRLVLLRIFPDFDAEAAADGLRVARTYSCLEFEGKVALLDPSRLPPIVASTRPA